MTGHRRLCLNLLRPTRPVSATHRSSLTFLGPIRPAAVNHHDVLCLPLFEPVRPGAVNHHRSSLPPFEISTLTTEISFLFTTLHLSTS